MSEESIKPISKKQFAFFKGIALVLFAIILTLNMWYIARTITFPFVYTFGLLSYLIFIYFYVQGAFYIIKGERLKHKNKIRFFGFLLTFVSLSALVTAFTKVPYKAKTYNKFFKTLKYIS